MEATAVAILFPHLAVMNPLEAARILPEISIFRCRIVQSHVLLMFRTITSPQQELQTITRWYRPTRTNSIMVCEHYVGLQKVHGLANIVSDISKVTTY
jgi:hypothetical protein